MRLSLFQTILLAVFGVAALIGVFVFATYTAKNNGGQTVGTVVIWGTLPKAAVDAAIQTGVQAGGDLKGVSYVQKSPATFNADLTSAIASGSGPDLVLISQEQLLPLNKLIQTIPASTLAQSSFTTAFAEEGNLFYAPSGSGALGIPFLIDPLVLFDNRTILSSTGIATPPSTWEAITGLVPLATNKSPTSAITQALIALGTYDNVHDARGILSALFLQAGVPITQISANGFTRTDLGASVSQQGVAPGQAVLRFYTQFADPAKVSYTWNAAMPDSQSAFLTGTLALYLGFASEAKYFMVANPNLDFEAAPLPQPATASTKRTYGLVYGFAIPRGSANFSGAFQTAAALTGLTEDQAAAAVAGMAPADRSLLSSPPSDRTGAIAYSSALYSVGWLSPAPADTDRAFSAMINNVISGRLTLDAALANAANVLAAALPQ